MVFDGSSRFPVSARTSRRALLGGLGATLAGLVACGDESSDRQFVGDPRTPTSSREEASPDVRTAATGSPTPMVTPLPTSQLLGARGTIDRVGLGSVHEFRIVDVQSGNSQVIWRDENRILWAAELDPTGAIAAVLSSALDSESAFAVDFIDSGTAGGVRIVVGEQLASPAAIPDAVAGGDGGIAWIADRPEVVVALPTGGLLRVQPNGSIARVADPIVAKRPGAVSITSDATTVAWVDRPLAGGGTGIFGGSFRALPIDPVTLLPADRSGNRNARGVQWVPGDSRMVTIIEGEELGRPHGDLFVVDVHTSFPELLWASPPGPERASVEAFTVAPDGLVVAFSTNSNRQGSERPTSVLIKQLDGPSIERFELPLELTDMRLTFTIEGLAVTGFEGGDGAQLGSAWLVTPDGDIESIYQDDGLATPIAVDEGTPVASPAASPGASPNASPLASPVASPRSSPTVGRITAQFRSLRRRTAALRLR